MTALVKTIGLRGPVEIPEPEVLADLATLDPAAVVQFNEGGDLDLSGKKIILQSADETRWEITVSDLGALVVTEIVED